MAYEREQVRENSNSNEAGKESGEEFFRRWSAAVANRVANRLYTPEREFKSFIPNVWTLTFLKGIDTVTLPPNPRVVELGIGTGIATAYILEKWPDAEVIGTDIVEDAIRLSKQNIKMIVNEEASRRCTFLVGDILSCFRKFHKTRRPIQAIFACLPVRPDDVSNLQTLVDENRTKSFYAPERYQSSYHAWGLGVYDTLLREALEVLPSGGTVLVTCQSGEQERKLKELFEMRQFKCDVVACEESTPKSEGELWEKVSALKGVKRDVATR